MSNYVYIIQEREFVRLGEPTYKIGKTGQETPWDRLKQYPKGSETYLLLKVDDKDEFERKILALFRNKYKQMSDYGVEYFQGDVKEMVQDFVNIQNNTDVKIKAPEPEPETKPELTSMNDLINKCDDMSLMEDQNIEDDEIQIKHFKNILKRRGTQQLRTRLISIERKLEKYRDYIELFQTYTVQKIALKGILLERGCAL